MAIIYDIQNSGAERFANYVKELQLKNKCLGVDEKDHHTEFYFDNLNDKDDAILSKCATVCNK